MTSAVVRKASGSAVAFDDVLVLLRREGVLVVPGLSAYQGASVRESLEAKGSLC